MHFVPSNNFHFLSRLLIACFFLFNVSCNKPIFQKDNQKDAPISAVQGTTSTPADKTPESVLKRRETNNIAPTQLSALIETVLLGEPKEAATALLDATYDEKTALACVDLLLPRLSECEETIMDVKVLEREERQPLWMRLPQERHPWGRLFARKHQILTRLANCIREATPSVEQTEKRKIFLSTIESFLFDDFQHYVDLMCQSTVFTNNIRTETGWEDLFQVLDKYVSSEGISAQNFSCLFEPYVSFCLQYPEKQNDIIASHTPKFRDKLAEWLDFVHQRSETNTVYCTETDYRNLLSMTSNEWFKIFNDKEKNECNCPSLVLLLVTGSRVARQESLEIAKPVIMEQTGADGRRPYTNWDFRLLTEYCYPLPEDASIDAKKQQDWIIDLLSKTLKKVESGNFEKSYPIHCLRLLCVRDCDEVQYANIQQIYAKDTIINLILQQVTSSKPLLAKTALNELDILRSLDVGTAQRIVEQLQKALGVVEKISYPKNFQPQTENEIIRERIIEILKRA